jgi:hypothetical protein
VAVKDIPHVVVPSSVVDPLEQPTMDANVNTNMTTIPVILVLLITIIHTIG